MVTEITLKILFTMALVTLQGYSQKVTLYTDDNKAGITSVTKDLKDQSCIARLAVEMNISSVDTHGKCLQFYKDENCCGESIQVSGVGKQNLKWWDYDNIVSSIGQCDNPCSFWRDPKMPVNVTLYENEYYKGKSAVPDLRVRCVNVRSLLKSIMSIRSPEVCVNLYKEVDCLGESFSLPPHTPMESANFQHWPRWNDSVSSLSLCDYACPRPPNEIKPGTKSENVNRKVITIFGQPCFQKGSYEHLYVRDGVCKNLHSHKMMKSVRTYGNCFIVYSSTDCKGNNQTLPNIESQTEIQNITFGKIKSIEICPDIQQSHRHRLDGDEYPVKMSMTDLFVIVAVFVILFIAALVIIIYVLRKQKRHSQGLSENDIVEFKAGCKEEFEVSNVPIQDQIYNEAYNTTFEMSRGSFFIDFRARLGFGEYGRVYKGSLGYNYSSPVAIKTARPNSDVQYLKTLLREVKLMIYAGKHPHIVDLLGCCTENINKGEIFLILELCANGALDKYLRKHQPAFQDLLEGTSTISEDGLMRGSDSREYFHFNTLLLMRWILQIAEGMNFLANKNIIHGDLATRNVLLDLKNNAKVSDFGLPNRLYQYSQYEKKKQVPLPWRWLAIESLKSFEFSLESDIWAFGITMWEIFTLGDIPYSGLTWDENFAKMLKDGLRLPKPEYSTNNHYNIMLDCWKEVPSERPSFPAIRTRLQKVYSECMKHEPVNHLHMSIYCVPHLPCISE